MHARLSLVSSHLEQPKEEASPASFFSLVKKRPGEWHVAEEVVYCY
jgi:hypothetical protein